jgi:hypothetical protein
MKSVRGWSFAQRALYRELLDIQWQEGVIPKEPERCRQMTGCPRDLWIESWPVVEEKFPLIASASGYRQNPKMAVERASALRAIAIQIEAGKRGGEVSAKQRVTKGTLDDPSTVEQPDIDLRSRAKSESKASPVSNLISTSGVVEPKNNSASRPATRLPADFKLDLERRSYAEAQGLDAARTFENFTDYWKAASGQKARKHDWDATWRTWCRNETTRAKGTKTQRRPKTVAELEAEERARADQ